jgi:hypothetical protein
MKVRSSVSRLAAAPPLTVKAVKVARYVRIDVEKDEARLTAIDVDGNEIDAFTVPRRR